MVLLYVHKLRRIAVHALHRAVYDNQKKSSPARDVDGVFFTKCLDDSYQLSTANTEAWLIAPPPRALAPSSC